MDGHRPARSFRQPDVKFLSCVIAVTDVDMGRFEARPIFLSILSLLFSFRETGASVGVSFSAALVAVGFSSLQTEGAATKNAKKIAVALDFTVIGRIGSSGKPIPA
jgi:hypothetical protein